MSPGIGFEEGRGNGGEEELDVHLAHTMKYVVPTYNTRRGVSDLFELASGKICA